MMGGRLVARVSVEGNLVRIVSAVDPGQVATVTLADWEGFLYETQGVGGGPRRVAHGRVSTYKHRRCRRQGFACGHRPDSTLSASPWPGSWLRFDYSGPADPRGRGRTGARIARTSARSDRLSVGQALTMRRARAAGALVALAPTRAIAARSSAVSAAARAWPPSDVTAWRVSGSIRSGILGGYRKRGCNAG